MKTFFLATALTLAGSLSACSFIPPKAPVPADSTRIPVNATPPAPAIQAGDSL
ncbi:conjugal transfer protein [Castellaniella sp.]|uniref:conjugal transfer protein n=1 Tax=Castellaniella sp. TaxID=1955812 RepID=UPI002AFF925A|nr:conjugal transfer protein [Castellaniella sp.]